MQVVALIREENGVYRASFPDFPGCTTAANDPNTVIAKASEALSHHTARMIADGREVPQVRSLAWFAADPTFLADSGSLMIVLVSYTPAPREVRVEVTFDESLLARIDRATEGTQETQSEYIAGAVRQRLTDEGKTDPDVAFSALCPTPHRVGASEVEGSISTQAVPGDTAASLACIKEILERLDSSPIKENRQPVRNPANMKPNQQLLLKPAR
jgi:predicted RNase H-like HicB family nuclease